MFADLLMPYWSFAWIPWYGERNATYDIEMEWKGKRARHSGEGVRREVALHRKIGESTQGQNLASSARKRKVCSQCTQEATEEMNSTIGFKERAPGDAFKNYKIAVLIDGNSAPSSKALEYFATSSLVLWQKTTEFEFFYNSLGPYKHYIPLSDDLCDLISKIDWILSHEEHAKAIIGNHLAFSSKYLCADAITYFMAESLNRYTASFPTGAIEITNRDIDFVESIRNQTYVHHHFQDYMGDRCINGVL
eukprot:jgi/Picsp_1/1135/NSC_04616-R1_kdel motif-containing protein 1-like